MPSLSLALICKNEEANLPRWLEIASRFADEIVAVDSGSEDRTKELLLAAGARVEDREWTGYADLRNYTASLCNMEWILFLDGDEFADEEMVAALIAFKASPPPPENYLAINRKVFFFGSWLRHGGFFPEYVTRLYKRGSAVWPQRRVHESLSTIGPVGKLPGCVEHHSYTSVGEYLRRMERYSREAALEMHAEGKVTTPFIAWSHAWWNFASRYILRLGFLDGYPGYLAARLESLYTLIKYTRLGELLARQRGD